MAWTKLQADESYRTVRQYDNGVVQVTLLWSGRVSASDAQTYEEYWPVYILLVKNYKPDGSLAVDPADSDKTFPNEGKGIAAYEEFLVKWTECETSEHTGEFIEEGNDLAPIVPPPPPDPNKPQTEAVELGSTGAW